MLVVSRTEGEAVSLPDLDVSVRVLRIAGSRVRIGVEAPAQIRVLRSELEMHSPRPLNAEDTARAAAMLEEIHRCQVNLAQAQSLIQRGDLGAARMVLAQSIAHWDALTESSSQATKSRTCNEEMDASNTAYPAAAKLVASPRNSTENHTSEAGGENEPECTEYPNQALLYAVTRSSGTSLRIRETGASESYWKQTADEAAAELAPAPSIEAALVC